MVIIYLDIETFSEKKELKIGHMKIILINFKEVFSKENIKITILKEWESSEKDILKQFYNHFQLLLKTEKTVWVIGFNILRFDVPVLINKLVNHSIASLPQVLEFFRNIYITDLRQCLLPFSKFRFKNLSTNKIAEKLQIKKPKYDNKEIRKFYTEKNYGKIEEHSYSDIDFIQNLYWILKREPEKLKKLELA